MSLTFPAIYELYSKKYITERLFLQTRASQRSNRSAKGTGKLLRPGTSKWREQKMIYAQLRPRLIIKIKVLPITRYAETPYKTGVTSKIYWFVSPIFTS